MLQVYGNVNEIQIDDILECVDYLYFEGERFSYYFSDNTEKTLVACINKQCLTLELIEAVLQALRFTGNKLDKGAIRICCDGINVNLYYCKGTDSLLEVVKHKYSSMTYDSIKGMYINVSQLAQLAEEIKSELILGGM